MPALITHRLFGEESIDRLPAGVISSEEDRTAFLIANQGPDPFFFRVRTPNIKACMTLGHVMHNKRMTSAFQMLRDGVGRLQKHDAGTGRAFALGLLSHYVLDRNAHPFVYAQQWGILDADPSLATAGGKIHAIIESDLDVLMLQLKRNGATTADYPPEGVLVTTGRIGTIAGVLTSYVAGAVYGLNVDASEYGGAVADMKLLYKLIEPAGAPLSKSLAALEGLGGNYSLLGSLAHQVTTEAPARTGNLEHLTWNNPFTLAASTESFPEVFDRALDDYEQAAARFIDGADMAAMTRHLNYSGRPLAEDEEFEGDD